MTQDLLDLPKINALPQPLAARMYGQWWDIHDIDVSSGLIRLDICGLLQIGHIGGLLLFKDASGATHDTASFYIEE